MARHEPSYLLPKARLGAAQYWPPLENRVSNFKLTVLSRQEEFLSGTSTVGKLCVSTFSSAWSFSAFVTLSLLLLEKRAEVGWTGEGDPKGIVEPGSPSQAWPNPSRHPFPE